MKQTCCLKTTARADVNNLARDHSIHGHPLHGHPRMDWPDSISAPVCKSVEEWGLHFRRGKPVLHPQSFLWAQAARG